MALAVELVAALLICAGYLAGIVPLSPTPFLVGLGWLSLRLRGLRWRDVGWSRPSNWASTVTLSVSVGTMYQLFSLFVQEPVIVRLTHVPINLTSVENIPHNIVLFTIFLLLVWTLAAFGEELAYRGYLMNRLAAFGGGTTTAWLTSLVAVNVAFGITHWYQGVSGAIDTALAGVVFALWYLSRNRNLWAAIVAHGAYDTVGLLLIYWGRYPGLAK